MFWVVALILGLNSERMIDVFIWGGALFVAILVHELGHALTMRRFGLRPWITLHGMGGLASYDMAQLQASRASGWINQILISVAGPGAGFVLAMLTIALVIASGHSIGVYFGAPYGVFVMAQGIATPAAREFTNSLLFICVIWGMVNLLPIYPLDGGPDCPRDSPPDQSARGHPSLVGSFDDGGGDFGRLGPISDHRPSETCGRNGCSSDPRPCEAQVFSWQYCSAIWPTPVTRPCRPTAGRGPRW